MPPPLELLPSSPVISVTELNRTIRLTLEQSFPLTWIAGEISNFVRAASGHWYFSLKDANSQVRCVMFRSKSQYLDWQPENGAQVEIRALVTLYEARGDFQLNVETLRRSGVGALYEAYARLKARLEQEGLFEVARKKPLPAFPSQIGIITSLQAAALKDVLTTLRRRMPSIPVILYPTPVQGEGAAQKIVACIHAATARAECDVLILCRGGGSIEDLWQFNEEIVARAIAACAIPIVCGIGHETDFTIADFVADQRAATPTAAAELVSPHRENLLARLSQLHAGLLRAVTRNQEQRGQQLDYLARRLQHPGARLQNQLQHLGHLTQRYTQAWHRSQDKRMGRVRELSQRLLANRPDLPRRNARLEELSQRLVLATQRRMESRATQLAGVQMHLVHLNPQSVFERGYSMVENAQGKIVSDSTSVAVDSPLKITFAKGWAAVIATATDQEESHENEKK